MKIIKNLMLIACVVIVLYFFIILDFEPEDIPSTHHTIIKTTYQWVEVELTQVKQENGKGSQDIRSLTPATHAVKARNVSVSILNTNNVTGHVKDKTLKYVLLWTRNSYPFHVLQDGTQSFQENKCKFRNCFLTGNVSMLNHHKDFDAIIFSGCELRWNKNIDLFRDRSPSQKYVFAQLEPAPMYVLTNPIFDNFFNWTWTYKLSSSIPWRYFTIYNLKGQEVGPKTTMKWPDVYEPISSHLKKMIDYKFKPIAWFVSHCVTQSRRESFAVNFEMELNKFGYSIDVYGKCGPLICSRTAWCHKMLEKQYYFYLAFENSLDDDYVTEKLFTAVNNLVVPVVYGGALYSRFLPPGSYIDARELGPKNLAIVIDTVLKNKTLYYDYFRWRNNFKYKSEHSTSEVCGICKALNEKKTMRRSSIQKFRQWWNGPTRQRTYDILLKNFLNNKGMIELARNYNNTHANNVVIWNVIKNQNPAELLGVSAVYEDVEEDIGLVNNYSYDSTTNSNDSLKIDINKILKSSPFPNISSESIPDLGDTEAANIASDLAESPKTTNNFNYSPQSVTDANSTEYFDYEMFKIMHNFIETQ